MELSKSEIINDDVNELWKKASVQFPTLFRLIEDSVILIKNNEKRFSEPSHISNIIVSINESLQNIEEIIRENKWNLPYLLEHIDFIIGMLSMINDKVEDFERFRKEDEKVPAELRGDYEGDEILRIMGNLINEVKRFITIVIEKIEPYFKNKKS